MPPKHTESQILEQLEQVINRMQAQESDKQKEQKSHNFTIFMFILSVLINGIAIKYFVWVTDQMYIHDKQIELIKMKMESLEKDISKLDAKQQQLLSIIQNTGK